MPFMPLRQELPHFDVGIACLLSMDARISGRIRKKMKCEGMVGTSIREIEAHLQIGFIATGLETGLIPVCLN
jgi:hypothetical protein